MTRRVTGILGCPVPTVVAAAIPGQFAVFKLMMTSPDDSPWQVPSTEI